MRLRKWLELPKRLSSAALYGNKNYAKSSSYQPQKEFLVTRTSVVLQFREFKNQK